MAIRRMTRSAVSAIQRNNVELVALQPVGAPPKKKSKLLSGESFAQDSASVEIQQTVGQASVSGTGSVTVSHLAPKAKKGKAKGKAKPNDEEHDRNQFLPRLDSPWKIGAHVSAAGGVENAVVNASSIGANSFALFLKSQRKWTSPALSEQSILSFKQKMKEYSYESRHVLPHGSYLINLANPDLEKREKSYDCFLDDLRRCEALGLDLYNFHPGSTVGAITVEEGIENIASCINRAHKETKGVTIVLENMAGAGNIVGGDFAHLAGIIKLVEDKTRVGVCIDTCHAFAAGYDIRTKDGWNDTMRQFTETVGLSYLRAFHLNDSLCGLSSCKDRHQNIGLGELGLLAFKHIVQDNRTRNLPMVLETPSFEMPKEVWGVEIDVLGRLSMEDNSHNSGSIVEVDLVASGVEIRAAVKGAEAKSGKGKEGKGKSNKRPKYGKRKRGMQSEGIHEEDSAYEDDE